MLTSPTAPFLLAQALVERGLLDSIAAGFTSARYRAELYIGDGNLKYLIGALVVVLILTRVRRRS